AGVIVTHDLVDALTLADRIVVLDNGVVVDEGPVDRVLRSPRSAFAADLAGMNMLGGRAVQVSGPAPGARSAAQGDGPEVSGGRSAVSAPRADDAAGAPPATGSVRDAARRRRVRPGGRRGGLSALFRVGRGRGDSDGGDSGGGGSG